MMKSGLFVFVLLSISTSTVRSFSPLPMLLRENTIGIQTARTKRRLYIDNTSDMGASGGNGSVTRRPTTSSRQIKPKETIQAVDTMDEFDAVVRKEPDRIVVVRFHAPYCKACQAIRVAYDRLAKRNANNAVKFVDVSVTEKNDLSHQLGIPGVPFGQIHVPGAGLVEELPMSRRHMAKFKNTLETYVKGMCTLPDDFFDNSHQLNENENLIL